LSSFGNITEETIDNLNRLSDIDTDAFSNLIEALQGLDFSKISHIGGKDAQKNLQAISSFIAQLNSIFGDGTKNLSGMFSKFRARRIGKTVGAFFDAMFDAMLKNKKEINVKV
jgi:phage-related protein